MKKKTTVLLCAGLVICLSGSICVQIKADDAFVVEEEVIIGGENLQEGEGQGVPHVQPSEVSPPAVQERSVKQEYPGETSGSKPFKERKEEAIEVSAPEETVSVSQNRLAPAFQVPVRRKETKAPEEKGDDKALQPPDSEDEPENPSATSDRNPWWMLVAGGVFFLGGCVRILWRIKSRIAGVRYSYRGI